jgi:hypothetical protein
MRQRRISINHEAQNRIGSMKIRVWLPSIRLRRDLSSYRMHCPGLTVDSPPRAENFVVIPAHAGIQKVNGGETMVSQSPIRQAGVPPPCVHPRPNFNLDSRFRGNDGLEPVAYRLRPRADLAGPASRRDWLTERCCGAGDTTFCTKERSPHFPH